MNMNFLWWQRKQKEKKGRGEGVFDNSFSLLICVNNLKFYPDNFVHHYKTSGLKSEAKGFNLI